jgi:hypothetical protein
VYLELLASCDADFLARDLLGRTPAHVLAAKSRVFGRKNAENGPEIKVLGPKTAFFDAKTVFFDAKMASLNPKMTDNGGNGAEMDADSSLMCFIGEMCPHCDGYVSLIF